MAQRDLDDEQRGFSSDESEEDLPIAEVKTEDKSKIIKSIIILILYYSVIIYSLIYCNSPDSESNLLLENYEEESNLIINKIELKLISKKKIYKGIIYLFKKKDNKRNNWIFSFEFQFNEEFINLEAKIIENNNYFENIKKEKIIQIMNNDINNKIEIDDISFSNKLLNLTKNLNFTDLFE